MNSPATITASEPGASIAGMATTIAGALKDLQVRIAEREEYRRFYRGKHGVHLRTPDLRRALDGHRPFALNFCKVIVDSLTDRVQVRAITAETDDDTPGDASDEAIEADEANDATIAAQAIWERSALDVTSLAWRYAVDGDAYVGLELDERVLKQVSPPMIAVNTIATLKAIDGDMVAPLDDGSLFIQTGDTTGMLVAPDGMTAIYHEMSQGGEWAPVTFTDTESGESSFGILATTAADGTPLRIIERIRNGDTGDAWGSSDLDVAVPQQRAINARAIDIHQVAGTAAWPSNWIVGQGASAAAGKLLSRPGAIHGIEAGESGMSLHQFAAADPTKIGTTLADLIDYLSVTSGTPLQSSVGANASGESRRIAQDRLTRRVMKALAALGGAIGRMLDSALLAEGAGEATVEVQWESPEPVAEKDALESANMKLALGVSRNTLLAELGYNPEREAFYRAAERAEEQVSMTRAITTGTDGPGDLAALLSSTVDA